MRNFALLRNLRRHHLFQSVQRGGSTHRSKIRKSFRSASSSPPMGHAFHLQERKQRLYFGMQC